MSREVREPYLELDQKIQFLMDDAEARRICGHNATFASFAKCTNLDRGQLGLAIGDPEAGDGRQSGDLKLSKTYAERIAAACGFNPDWAEWKIGTAEDFKKTCRGHWEQQRTPRPSVLLIRGARAEPMPSQIAGLVSVEVDGAQVGYGTVDIGIDVSCGVAFLQGRNISVRSGRVALGCGQAILTQDCYKAVRGAPRKLSGSHGEVSVMYSAGTRGKPALRLDSAGATIGNIEMEPGFLALEGLHADSVVTIEFGTWLMDIAEVDGVADIPADGLADGISLVRADGTELQLPTENLSAIKRNIIAALRKSVLAADANGYVTLARHELKFAEAGAE